MGCAPARYCSRTTTFFVWVWCWQWPEIFGVAYDPSPPPPQSIRLFFPLNLWCSHRKGVNKQKMQPLHTVNSHVVIVMISSCLCEKHMDYRPGTWWSSLLWKLFLLERHTNRHTWSPLLGHGWKKAWKETVFWKMTIRPRVNRDSSVYLLDAFRLRVPHSSGSGSPAMQKIFIAWL